MSLNFQKSNSLFVLAMFEKDEFPHKPLYIEVSYYPIKLLGIIDLNPIKFDMTDTITS